MTALPESALPPPLDGIIGGWAFTIPAGHRRLGIVTPPHHLVHLLTDGAYTLAIDGDTYEVDAGDLIYYPAGARVDWLDNAVPIRFLSISFAAPGWTYRATRRVQRDWRRHRADFEEVVQLCQAPQPTPHQHLRGYQAMLAILLALEELTGKRPAARSRETLWWTIERHIRQCQDWHMPVNAMGDLVQRSRSTVHRACLAATGTPPADRLRQLRLEQARDLLIHSPQSITSIAESLGYNRLQEFSRDYSRQLGEPPSAFRQRHNLA